ncbi:MAG: DMT family transporter [Pseudomonadota bacterium]
MNQIYRPGALELFGLFAIALIWGSAFPAIKLAVFDFGAFWTAAIRVTVGFLAMLPFVFFRLSDLKALRGNWYTILFVALLNMVIPFVLISWSMKHVPAGIGSLLLGTTPFVAMILGHFLTRDERINGYKLISVIFAVSGIAVLVGQDIARQTGTVSILAQGAIILAGACYVSAGFVMRRIDIPPVTFTAAALGAGSIMLLGISFLVAGAPNLAPSKAGFYAVFWLGLLPTGLGYFLRYILVRKVGVSTFALAMNTVPIFGIILSTLILGEVIEFRMIIALALVLIGLMIARYAVPGKVETVR